MGDEPVYDQALSGDVTELAPSVSETVVQTAWALDDGPEWRQPFWSAGRVVGVAFGLAVVAAIGVAGFAGYQLNEDDAPSVPSASPAPAAPVFIPTTTEPRPAGWAAKPGDPMTITHGSYTDAQLLQFDDVFISRLRGGGWTITNPRFVSAVGRGVCASYALGTSLSRVTELLRGRYSSGDANALVAAAEIVYPDCTAPY